MTDPIQLAILQANNESKNSVEISTAENEANQEETIYQQPRNNLPLEKNVELETRRQEAIELDKVDNRTEQELIEKDIALESLKNQLTGTNDYKILVDVLNEYKRLSKERRDRSKLNIEKGIDVFAYPMKEIGEEPREQPTPPQIPNLPLRPV